MALPDRSNPGVHRALWGWCWFVLIWASFAIFLGANVTTTESGDAAPDWPASWNGEFGPPSQWFEKFSLRNELSHRYAVSILVALAVVLAIWVHRKRKDRTVRVLAWGSVGILLIQALLGGARVLLAGSDLQNWIPIEASAVAHAVLAEVFFCTLIGLLSALSPAWVRTERRPMDAQGLSILRLGLISLVLLLVQLTLGALARHGFLPREVHAMFALVVVIFLVKLVLATAGDLPREQGFLRSPGKLVAVLVGVQVLLGIWTYIAAIETVERYSRNFEQIAVLNMHLVVGAWLLGSTLSLLLRTVRVYGLPTDERVAALRGSSATESSS